MYHTADFKAETARGQAAGRGILRGWVCRSPPRAHGQRVRLPVHRHASGSKQPAEGPALVHVESSPIDFAETHQLFSKAGPLAAAASWELSLSKNFFFFKSTSDVSLNNSLKKDQGELLKGRAPPTLTPDRFASMAGALELFTGWACLWAWSVESGRRRFHQAATLGKANAGERWETRLCFL